MRAVSILTCVILLLFVPSAQGQEAMVMEEIRLEPLTGLGITKDSISITVLNSGYTNKGSFKVIIAQEPPSKTRLVLFVRIKEDPGKMVPQPLDLNYPLKSLGFEKFVSLKVLNPVIPGAGWRF